MQDSAPQLEQDLSATSSEKCVNETFPQTTEVEIALPPSPPLEQPPPSLTVVSEIPVAISESPVTVEEISINVEETLTSAEEITLGETPVSVKETPNPIDENLIREENSVKVEESSPSKEITSPAEELSIKNSTVLVETESNPPEMNATSTEDASSEEIAALEEKKTTVSVEEANPSSEESLLVEETSVPAEETLVNVTSNLHEQPKEVEKSLKIFPDNVENDSLEQVLHELQRDMISATEVAVASLEASADAVVSHIGIMQSVLESNLAARDDNSWNQVSHFFITNNFHLNLRCLKTLTIKILFNRPPSNLL